MHFERKVLSIFKNACTRICQIQIPSNLLVIEIMQYSLHCWNFQFILSALGHHFDSRVMNIGYFISDYLVPRTAFYKHCQLGLICQILFSFILTRLGFCFFTMSLDLEETCQTYTISRLYTCTCIYVNSHKTESTECCFS